MTVINAFFVFVGVTSTAFGSPARCCKLAARARNLLARITPRRRPVGYTATQSGAGVHCVHWGRLVSRLLYQAGFAESGIGRWRTCNDRIHVRWEINKHTEKLSLHAAEVYMLEFQLNVKLLTYKIKTPTVGCNTLIFTMGTDQNTITGTFTSRHFHPDCVCSADVPSSLIRLRVYFRQVCRIRGAQVSTCSLNKPCIPPNETVAHNYLITWHLKIVLLSIQTSAYD